MTSKKVNQTIVVVSEDNLDKQKKEYASGGEDIATRSELTFAGTIRKNGSSFYVTISSIDLKKMGLSDGDDVDIIVKLPKPPIKESE